MKFRTDSILDLRAHETLACVAGARKERGIGDGLARDHEGSFARIPLLEVLIRQRLLTDRCLFSQTLAA